MARRRKTSPAEDLMDLVDMLPWWAGVGLAQLFAASCRRLSAGRRHDPARANGCDAHADPLEDVRQYVLSIICLADTRLGRPGDGPGQGLVRRLLNATAQGHGASPSPQSKCPCPRTEVQLQCDTALSSPFGRLISQTTNIDPSISIVAMA